ncbi:unnamed protein product, partial [Brassica oleracea var. botrytis]
MQLGLSPLANVLQLGRGLVRGMQTSNWRVISRWLLHCRNMGRVLWFEVSFGFRRSASWITIWILWLLHCRIRVRKLTVHKLATCWIV